MQCFINLTLQSILYLSIWTAIIRVKMQEQCPDINLCFTIPFQSVEYATLACDVLNVDRELKGSGVSRDISTNSESLVINLNGQDLKRLRVSANSMLKNVILITKTFNQFEQN